MKFRKLISEADSGIKKAAIKFVKELKKNPQNYAYQLTRLTEWGFWAESGGEPLLSADTKTLKKVANELGKFIKYAPDHFLVELNEMFDFYEMNESKKPTVKDVAKIISNEDEWGDMGDYVSVVKGKLRVVDTYFYGGEEALEKLKEEWLSPSGLYSTYFKDLLGVTFKLEEELIQPIARGAYRKITKDGIVAIFLRIK
jgi:hypothetical protein